MREYDIFLPTTLDDGTPIQEAEISAIKTHLAQAFGGYTHFDQKSEGAWRVGGVTFRDVVTVVRVLDDGSTNFDMAQFAQQIARRLEQRSILVVCRDVTVV